MNSFNPTDRFDDLIEEIDQTSLLKRNRVLILFLLLVCVFTFTSYLSFNTSNKISENSTTSQQIDNGQTSIYKSNINTPPYKPSIEADSPKGLKTNYDGQTDRTSAQFPGGSQGVAQYLKDNIQYPDSAFDEQIEGKVLVQITIDKKGKVNNPIIMEGLGYGCDEEVIRVLSDMPDWKPATDKNQTINKSYILTVTFSLG